MKSDEAFYHKRLYEHVLAFPIRVFLRLVVALCFGIWGVENRSSGLSGNFICVANHKSHLETGLIMTILIWKSFQIRVLAAKDHFFKGHVFGTWFRCLVYNTCPLDRYTDKALEALDLPLKALVEWELSLLVYPSGSRKATTFKSGFAYLARESGRPVVPIAHVGTGRVWPPGRWYFVPGPVRIIIGEPLSIGSGESIRVFTQRVEAAVNALLAELSVEKTA
ncbi:MAG: 1-acyl-sn-glycerol-3-phosphate acyltransferase [Candidatus Jacksonbacteria bacterium]|jgi:1-acyl-sn-glycerol-3-phosphate acyltransferase|nr:1-acyl-sn-glycerol-3-phosphate acyltransferase [Candidatus Jacksonbacteria bacterium]MBT6034423.1 1-acyl-sn-glycerol-3-phosphate acyltransferase [Candidatus Jacksonbacteria bacterium]MBT6301656.1 1-acyl-sn-glycerol-3-phosphate acyltransferase [Candidatus Jacksonbacteria bacterium]MBT6757455.1 1-acyl-sn-glycerol-3-phosphate acyltransferase [Candidatus Jacksonbacteria bacterium]MBT6955205.1 1-acyl-sn-glycerol-3-phosphate acyltransferase [Candidatus Jacksonbacteria bacterium]